MKKALYKLLPFIPRFNLYVGQSLHVLGVKLNRKRIIKKLSAQTGLYANVGCGGCGLSEGWVNIDFGLHQHVTYTFDCSKSLPFAPGSVKGIFTEHFFEHIDYFTEVPSFLKHCYNALQDNGVLRIIIPDAEKYLIGYVEKGWDYLKKTRPLDDDLNDLQMGIKYQTKLQLVNEVFRQGGQHKYAWDFETLKLSLMEAGFSKIYKMGYRDSHDPKMAIDLLARQSESLYVEAIK